jgi:hypothetical protein
MLFSNLGIRQFDGHKSSVWSGQRGYDGLGQASIPDTPMEWTGLVIGAVVAGVIGGLIFSASTRILPVKTTK